MKRQNLFSGKKKKKKKHRKKQENYFKMLSAEIFTQHGEHYVLSRAKDETGYTPLHVAVQQGRLDIVKWLTACNINLNTETPTGYTAMHIAATNGHVNCMIVSDHIYTLCQGVYIFFVFSMCVCECVCLF